MAQEEKISSEILLAVGREITTLDRFLSSSNKRCQQVLDAFDGEKRGI
jgi:hypothetical protein